MTPYSTLFSRFSVLFFCLMALSPTLLFAESKEPIFSGKAYAAKRAELRTYGLGKIKTIDTTIGHYVKENSTLLSFEGDSEHLSELKQKLSLAKVYKLEWKRQEILRALDREERDAKLYDAYLNENMATKRQIEGVNVSIHSQEMHLDAINEELENAKDDVRASQEEAWYTLGIRNATSKDVKGLLRIHAPISGYILWVNPDFQVGAEMKHDIPAFIIGDMAHVKLFCEAYESSIQGLKEGRRVVVRFDAIEHSIYTGVISNIQWTSANAADKSKPAVFDVEVDIDNAKLEIKEGYVGHVYLED